jgi:hypothetical protein
MTLPAIGPRAAVAGVGGQQRLQQRAAQPGQPGPQRQLCPLNARPGGQRPGRCPRQPLYLGGRLRRELLAEPFFCPSGSGARPAAAGAGRASQIASLTSAICPVSSANSW